MHFLLIKISHIFLSVIRTKKPHKNNNNKKLSMLLNSVSSRKEINKYKQTYTDKLIKAGSTVNFQFADMKYLLASYL